MKAPWGTSHPRAPFLNLVEMARRSAAFALLLLVVLALLAPVSAGGGGKCPAESCRECVAKGCGWDASGLACHNKGIFGGFGKGVNTDIAQCTPLRDALTRMKDTSPKASETLVRAYDFIREKITAKSEL